MNLQMLDTETSSLSGEVIEFALVTCDEQLNVINVVNNLIKPTCPIDPMASCVNLISDDMLKDCPSFEEVLPKYKYNIEEDIFIAHNSSFDKKMLVKSGMTDLSDAKWLCTLKLAKALLPKRFGNDKLGTLFYGYKCDLTMEYKGASHRADFDVFMMREVLKEIMTEFNLDIHQAYEIATSPPPFGKSKCWFKKHKGESWENVKESDPDYCNWIKDTFEKDSKTKELLKFLNE